MSSKSEKYSNVETISPAVEPAGMSVEGLPGYISLTDPLADEFFSPNSARAFAKQFDQLNGGIDNV